jgi:hypothetical protein
MLLEEEEGDVKRPLLTLIVVGAGAWTVLVPAPA